MQYNKFGRTGWEVSELGYGMWGLAGWKESEPDESGEALQLAVDLGCNFFDTAWGYGAGKSEAILGQLIKANSTKKLYAASKIPPKNFKWPSRRGFTLDECFPADHIREYTEKTLQNLGLEKLDLMQFHVWEDDWAEDERWQRVTNDLKREGLVGAWGISINRWEPWNAIRTLRTGAIDAVQVIYNIFDQAPEDELFPVCQELNIGIIARVPFDEGTLTGTLTKETRWPEGDWRNGYFVPENLNASVDHAEALRAIIPPEMTMPEMALRFIISNPAVSTMIPGMRKVRNTRSNFESVEKGVLSPELISILREHRWDREPTEWSQ
jgi:aryl-alcohol dehydrogenase-like predicted oxidoreductase